MLTWYTSLFSDLALQPGADTGYKKRVTRCFACGNFVNNIIFIH